MINKYYLLISGTLLSLLVIGGCTATPTELPSSNIPITAPTPTLNEQAYPAPTFSGAYPAPTSYNPYPEPGMGQLATATEAPTAIPKTPDPNLGVVKGSLLLVDQPVARVILYLAEVVTSASGGRVVALDRTKSIRATTDEQGDFMFINVPPGAYGLVFDRIIDSYLLLTPAGDDLIMTITTNEQIDLGALNYDDLPIAPGQ